MSKLDRSSLNWIAVRNARSVEVHARFSAEISDDQMRKYAVVLHIDPRTRGLTAFHFSGGKAGSQYLALQGKGNDARQRIAHLVRDIVLKSNAWTILKDSEPDRKRVLNPDGTERVKSTAPDSA